MKNIIKPFVFKQNKLIFTHIPKCGGTSVHQMLYEIFDDKYRLFSGKPEQLKNTERLHAGGGHQKYGSNPVHNKGCELVYITILRNPFERLFSFYKHVQRNPHHHLYVKVPNIKSINFYHFLEHLISINNPEVSNLMCSMLAPNCTNAQQAIQQVEQEFSVVGIVENINSFTEKMQKMFPCHKIQIPRLNTGQGNPMSLDGKTQQLIKDSNSMDIELYAYFSKKTTNKVKKSIVN